MGAASAHHLALCRDLSWTGGLSGSPSPCSSALRLERLGPTYIKLGQILSLREDLLPKDITDELKNLLDRLPVVSFDRYKELIEADLKRPVDTIFHWIDPHPLGSASLAQTHRARLLTGERVVLKVLKAGVRQTVETDTKLLRLVGACCRSSSPVTNRRD